jgi:hypothetical protein
MSTVSPILACGSMHITAGDLALIYSVLGGWLASLVLAFVNPCLICFWDVSTRSKSAHLLIWAVYVGSGLVVWVRGLGGMQSQAWSIPVFGVPILAISHLVVLLWTRRQIRLKKKRATDDT